MILVVVDHHSIKVTKGRSTPGIFILLPNFFTFLLHSNFGRCLFTELTLLIP